MSLNSKKTNKKVTSNNKTDINKSNNLSKSQNNNSNKMNELSNNKSGSIIFKNSYSGLHSNHNNNDNINKKNVNSVGYKFSGITMNYKKEKHTFVSITLSKDLIHFSNEEIRINDYKILCKNIPPNKMKNKNKIFCDKFALNNDVFKINENLDDKSNNTELFGNFSNFNNNKRNNKINIFSYINQKDKNSENSDNNKKKGNTLFGDKNNNNKENNKLNNINKIKIKYS